jgi:exo-beta-1,3-glucanase (GH17 family)
MKPQRILPACFTIPMIVVSLSSCSRQHVAPGADRDPALAVRPFQPISDSRWIGNGICYGPHRDGQRPGGRTPTAAEIRADLDLMQPHWNLLRTYGAQDFARTLCEEIRAGALDMKVMLGVWIAAEEKRDEHGAVLSRDPEAAAANRREADAAIALAGEYPDIVAAVCVGNETQVSWSPFPSPVDILIGHLRRVRAAVAVPVTTADDYQYWNKPESRVLAREVDFITVHIHPLWNGRQLDDALPWLREQLAAVQAVHPDREVVIGETGWATAVAGEGEQSRLIKGATGEPQQAAFYEAVRAWAAAERVTTFIFEAFDENWKGGDDPEEVEKHWGMFRADRTAKTALGGASHP